MWLGRASWERERKISWILCSMIVQWLDRRNLDAFNGILKIVSPKPIHRIKNFQFNRPFFFSFFSFLYRLYRRSPTWNWAPVYGLYWDFFEIWLHFKNSFCIQSKWIWKWNDSIRRKAHTLQFILLDTKMKKRIKIQTTESIWKCSIHRSVNMKHH